VKRYRIIVADPPWPYEARMAGTWPPQNARDARVYLAFETKSGVLRALWNFLLRGDQEEVPISDRRWYREVLGDPDPERQLRLGAANARAVKERIGGVIEVIHAAAAIDPDIDALWKRIETEFHANQRVVVASIDEKGALRPELDVDRATDILWTLNHPDNWMHLVEERGWSPREYEKWLRQGSCAQLLAPE
jgi:hypothetical protein